MVRCHQFIKMPTDCTNCFLLLLVSAVSLYVKFYAKYYLNGKLGLSHLLLDIIVSSSSRVLTLIKQYGTSFML